MATISENLQTIKDSTDAIKQAIIDKGGTISGDITTWANVISNIQTGVQPTANLILNKVNGDYICDYNVVYELETVLYTYILSEDCRDVMVFMANDNSNFQDIYSTKDCTSNKNVFSFADNYCDMHQCYGYFDIMSKQAKVYCRLSGNEFNISAQHSVGSSPGSGWIYFKVVILCYGEEGLWDYDVFGVKMSDVSCLIKDTNISTYNGVTKKIQDITYNDELLVWNFDECKFDKSKPLWIKKTELTNSYYNVTLDNGQSIGLVGSNGRCHRLFDYDNMIFESATELVGKNIYTLSGIHKCVSVEKINQNIEYYNIITEYHMNCFANGILASCRCNNLYPIIDMKFDKSNVNLELPWKLNRDKFIPNPQILPKYISGLRLHENTNMTIDEMKDYCTNLKDREKTALDFSNNSITNNIEDSEVAWISPDGKSYGVSEYMPGIGTYNLIAKKICEDLNIQHGDPIKALEKLGYIKYDVYNKFKTDNANYNQLKKIDKFAYNIRNKKTLR